MPTCLHTHAGHVVIVCPLFPLGFSGYRTPSEICSGWRRLERERPRVPWRRLAAWRLPWVEHESQKWILGFWDFDLLWAGCIFFRNLEENGASLSPFVWLGGAEVFATAGDQSRWGTIRVEWFFRRNIHLATVLFCLCEPGDFGPPPPIWGGHACHVHEPFGHVPCSILYGRIPFFMEGVGRVRF